ncbi:cytochrome b/b6 domain-containing protein [Mangrovibacter yixingensis]|uniref:cytochrome b/b6 domain-containing protein n=1 Tax=Mangrovibacter yixingensis TaxID=1529639 RepID=UPI001CF97BE6|nr:cytochrome b/b6 domain-containing protein [Mangrovibacter yixingensis]
MLRTFWHYLGETQPRLLRVVHILIAVLVIGQIINSNATEVEAISDVSAGLLVFLCTWLHIIAGSLLVILGFALLFYVLVLRGFRYYYAWLLGDFSGIVKDLRTLAHFRLPEASAGGIAATVQGLGVGALLLVALSGAIGVALYLMGYVVGFNVIHWHKFLTGLIEVYIFAHGAMGLLHFALRQFLPVKRE